MRQECKNTIIFDITPPKPSNVDTTEEYRRQRQAELNEKVQAREACEKEHGKVWDTQEMTAEFQAIGFLAPFVVVERRSDGKKGTLEFQHQPRFYFNWVEDK